MSIPTLKRHENRKYYVHWTEGRRTKRTSTGTSSLAEAKDFFSQWLAMPKLDSDNVSKARVTVREAWDLYVSQPKQASITRYASIGRHLCASFGDVALVDVTQAHADRYLRDRTAGRIGRPAASSTVWLELNTFVTAMNFAVKKKLLTREERPEIKLPPAPDARDRWLTRGEAERLMAALPRGEKRLSRLERFLWIAFETAARKHVIETLTWAQVDFETKVIHFHRSGDARTKKRRPSVSISANLLPALQRAYAERVSELVLDHPAKLNHDLTVLAKRAGIPCVTPHVLRHTAATWMAREGVPLFTIAGVLGNTLAMVEKVYAKHCPEGIAAAVATISLRAVLERAPSDAPKLGDNLDSCSYDGAAILLRQPSDRSSDGIRKD